MSSKHTPFRLALELARLDRLAELWCEARAAGKDLSGLDERIAATIRRSRATENYLRRKGSK